MRFGLQRGQQSTRLTADDIYREELAVWQIRHRANHHDLTREQAGRFAFHNRCTNVGLDPRRVTFARWLVVRGSVSDG